jgi:RNA polymerase sigma-70 factor (ECF subfamily)
MSASRFCIIPRDLETRLERPMARFSDQAGVGVLFERRRTDRRRRGERRETDWPGDSETSFHGAERRRVRNVGGRRISEDRATLIPVAVEAELPRRALPYAERLAFVERIEPSEEYREDIDSARMVTRWQAGDQALFSDLYMRYFDRVYGYLRMALNDSHEAEDAAQQVFMQVMTALHRYELRSVPFRAWLFRIARNYSINHLTKLRKLDIEDPAELDRRRDVYCGMPEIDDGVLDWLSDKDLLVLIGRLPQAQRQVLILRFMLDLSSPEIAEVLGRSPDAVRQLQQRALTFLRSRLAALDRKPEVPSMRVPMRKLLRQAPVLRARRFALRA